ncbi:DUF2971 domain-containing protein [Vibrio vulnificus]|uniref:DUF2971 domain-containing protein n=1 Tax=Vibrio vulnificus TaxID=672 RepID=UPI004058F5F4
MAIFKYLGISAAKSYFEHQTIRFNTPDAYNDPHEMRVNFRSEVLLTERITNLNFHLHGNSKNIEQFLINELDDYPFKLDTSVYDEVCKTVGMSCFTTSNEEIPANILMWAHYAESHRGIAIKLKEDSEIVSMLSNVNYVYKAPVLDARFFSGDKVYISDMYFKSDEWKYENEKRLAIPLSECTTLETTDAYNYPIHVHELDAKNIEMVFLGSAASKELIKLGYEFNQKFGIPVIKQKARVDAFGFRPTVAFGQSEQECIELNRHYGLT